MKVSNSLQANYDNYYSSGESEWRKLGAKYKADNIISLCSAVPHSTILDIGAGEGAVMAALSERGFGQERYCLDISSSGIEVIRARNIPSLVSADLFDGYNINYPDNYFDLGIATHVLEHVEHERLFIREAARVCKYLFIEVPLEDTVRLPLDYASSLIGHINIYNHKTIRRLIQSIGLIVLEQRLLDTPLEVLRYESRSVGLIKFLIRRCLAVAPKFGSRVFTYHCSLLCARP